MEITQSIQQLKGIGEKNAALFKKLNIYTIEDLIFYLPKSYKQFPPIITPDNALSEESDFIAVEALVCTSPVISHVRNLSLLKFKAGYPGCPVPIYVTFFNSPYLKNSIKSMSRYIFYGRYTIKGNAIYMQQPKLYKKEEYLSCLNRLTPVYMCTKGLSNNIISKYIQAALGQIKLDDYMPSEILVKYKLCSLKEALTNLHSPMDADNVQAGKKRLAFDEFLLFILSMKINQDGKKCKSVYSMIETSDCKRLMERLPFCLTDSQTQAFNAIQNDMLSGFCMNRLLQGDVGSGKTIVAILSMLLCISNGYQAALMAPTEVLACQHYATILEMTQKYNLAFLPVLLTGSQSAKEKREIYKEIEAGRYNVVIGTHALIQDKVVFHNLALVITDEQHRFGVHQRELLKNKGQFTHTLVMSATPIPRSLAIILYGDLELSEMKNMPSKRLPIKNCVVDQRYRPTAYNFLQKEIDAGHQAYILCPMAEPGIMEELENVVDYSKSIKPYFKDETRIAYLHGKLKPKQKNEIMQAFSDGNIDILVSTTVVEVGINVVNATVMMVENAERFGLATLHQIRGRVGRGDAQSYCIFMQTEKKKNERLSILEKTNDGFEIASKDLKLRGPGDLQGIEQSGNFHFRFADPIADSEMLMNASVVAESIIKHNLLSNDNFKALNDRLNNYINNGLIDIL